MTNKTQRNPLGIKSLPSKKEALNQIRREEFLGGLGRGKSVIELDSELDMLEEQYALPKCFRTKEYSIKSYICRSCKLKDRCSQLNLGRKVLNTH